MHPQEELTKAKANSSNAPNENTTLGENSKNEQKLNYLSSMKQHVQDIMDENQRPKVVPVPVSARQRTSTTPPSSGKVRKF